MSKPVALDMGQWMRQTHQRLRQVEVGARAISVPVGATLGYIGATDPTGFMKADGRSLLRDDYPVLFGIIGTTYGSVDSTHFNIPTVANTIIRV